MSLTRACCTGWLILRAVFALATGAARVNIGTAALENPDWVRRKVNTVYRFHKSSYRVGREFALKGTAFDETRGLSLLEYVPAGGGTSPREENEPTLACCSLARNQVR